MALDNTRPQVDKPRQRPFTEMGSPGTAVYGGFIVESESDATLSGRAKYLTYSNFLANTTIVSAGVRLFLNLIAKAEWRAEPRDDSEEAVRMAELVDDILEDMDTPMHRVVRRAAMSRFYGFSTQEWVAKRREDGLIGLKDIEPRAQVTVDRWDVDAKGRVHGIVQKNPQNGQDHYIPRSKLIYVVDDTLNDSPEGLGLFRHISNSVKRLTRYEQLEGFGFETDLRGIPVVRAPLAALEGLVSDGKLTATQAAALRAPMETFLQKHARNPSLGMMMDSAVYRSEGEQKSPSGMRLWDVELLSGDGGPHKEVAEAIERINREIARVLGVEHLLLGSSDRGSFALSADKSQTFGLIVDSTLSELRESFEKDILGPIWKLNGFDPALRPHLRTESIAYRDIRSVTQALVDLQKAGAPLSPLDPAINDIRDRLGVALVPKELQEQQAAEAAAAALEDPDGKEDEEEGQDDNQPPQDEEE